MIDGIKRFAGKDKKRYLQRFHAGQLQTRFRATENGNVDL